MARLGFTIGKGLNKAFKFAAGAGAFESIGKGNKIAGVGKDLIGAGSRNAGSSLSERIRGGLSAVSPQFAQAENLRSAISSRKITDDLNIQKLEDIRFQNEQVPINGLLGDQIEHGAQDLIIQNLEQQGLVTTDPKTGAKVIKRGDAQTAMKELFNDPIRQRQLIQANIDSIDADLKKAMFRGNAELEKQMKAQANLRGMKMEDMTPAQLKEHRKFTLEQYQNGGIDSPTGRTIQADAEALQQKKATWEARLKAMNDAKALEAAKIRNLDADTASKKADQFESTKTFETLARGMFDGKSVAELTPEQVDKVIRRKFKEDPLKLQQTMDLRKEFNAIDSIKQFDATQTRFEQINGMLEATVSGDLKTRNTVDQVLINNFNKMMDESSVVRESEYARTPEGISLINRMKGAFQQKIDGGSGLTDEDRRDIQKAAEILQDQWLRTARSKADQYIHIANAQGTDPSLIVTNPLLRGAGEANQDNVNAFMQK